MFCVHSKPKSITYFCRVYMSCRFLFHYTFFFIPQILTDPALKPSDHRLYIRTGQSPSDTLDFSALIWRQLRAITIFLLPKIYYRICKYSLWWKYQKWVSRKILSHLTLVIYSNRQEALLLYHDKLLKCRSTDLLIPFTTMAHSSSHMSSMEVSHSSDHQMGLVIQMLNQKKTNSNKPKHWHIIVFKLHKCTISISIKKNTLQLNTHIQYSVFMVQL